MTKKIMCCTNWTSKQTFNYGLVLQKICRVIKLKQEAWLKPCVDVITKIRRKAKTKKIRKKILQVYE